MEGNETGELRPLGDLVAAARSHGALCPIDAAREGRPGLRPANDVAIR
jgi:hypothetical protein